MIRPAKPPGALSQPKKSWGKIEIVNAHLYGAPDLKRLRALARRVLRRESQHFGVLVIISDDAELRRLHRLFLGIDETTDVMAFAPDAAAGSLAEIYINLDQARQQALEDGETIQRALERLAVHGMLHLAGWKDDSANQRRRMLAHGETYLSDG